MGLRKAGHTPVAPPWDSACENERYPTGMQAWKGLGKRDHTRRNRHPGAGLAPELRDPGMSTETDAREHSAAVRRSCPAAKTATGVLRGPFSFLKPYEPGEVTLQVARGNPKKL